METLTADDRLEAIHNLSFTGIRLIPVHEANGIKVRAKMEDMFS
jgi:hypothetical protein